MIGIFGGSFDPPHKGHSEIIKGFWSVYPDASKLLVVPNYISPTKQEKLTTAKHVLKMLELMIVELPSYKIEVEKYEISKEEPSYTIDTILHLKQKYPEEEIYLIIGEDNLVNFHLWKSYNQVLELTDLVIFRRKLDVPSGVHITINRNRVHFMNNPFYSISSTNIRENIHLDSVKSQMYPSVYEYIKKSKLYL